MVHDPPPDAEGLIRLSHAEAFGQPVELQLADGPERAITVTLDGSVEALVVISPWSGKGKLRCDIDPWPISITARGLTVAGERRFTGLWPGRYRVQASFEGRRDCAVVELDDEHDGEVTLRVVEH